MRAFVDVEVSDCCKKHYVGWWVHCWQSLVYQSKGVFKHLSEHTIVGFLLEMAVLALKACYM